MFVFSRFLSVTKKNASPKSENAEMPQNCKLHSFTDGEPLGNEGRTQEFREKMLEFDLGVLELDVGGNEGGTTPDEVDEMVSKVVFSCAKRSLVSLVFVRNEEIQNENALCCLRVKE